jgi:hypothetical protein
LDVKRVELGDEFVMMMPKGWTWRQLRDGRWWCGDHRRRIACYLHHEIARPKPRIGGDPPSPLANARHWLGALRRTLGEHGTVGGIVESKTLSGGIVHAIVDDVEESGPCRTARWCAVTGYTHGASIFRLSLTVPIGSWNSPVVPQLIELLGEQAEFGTGTTSPIIESLGSRDLRLNPGAIISLPATWSASQDGRKTIITAPGRLFSILAEAELVEDPVECRALSLDGSVAHLPRPEFALRVARQFAQTLTVSTVCCPIELTPYGAIVTTELHGPKTPQGEGVAGTVWYYLIPQGETCVINAFYLYMPPELGDRSDVVEAKASFAREIANLRLDLEDMRD